jgi:hypothetical protein
MQVVNWLFLVSAGLFISGVGFIVASGRTTQGAAPSVIEAPAITPIASVKQIMAGIVAPAATLVFDSVGTVVDASGIHEKAPSTDAEWAALGSSAAALVESSNLLVMGDRAVDQQGWVKMSKALADAGMQVLFMPSRMVHREAMHRRMRA